ncbi:hypothetical protein MTO98_26390 [Mucilaginibacter sp. SMC90]|uniref:hypothetical protein n=1 Tax=Mucilaginibacter sp. SMC90 TaxID=2929803 RepID=UPI001FB3DD91|nr:hypothetical protein [Mucilaginibacter sp. SMC90]UOE47944.1 hypothetical protein MTO98_26390 [Mucilaginibacter sp. SMC90]
MKKLLTLLLIICAFKSQAQYNATNFPNNIDKLFAQEYSKDASEFLTKVYISRNILKLNENELTGFQIDAITAAKSGELTTVLYNCPKLNQKGLVFVFYNYKHFSFYHFEFNEAKVLLDKISAAVEDNKQVLDEVNTSVLKANDIHLIFAESSIRVVWDEYDSNWDKSNFKTTYRRFDKFFKKQFKG